MMVFRIKIRQPLANTFPLYAHASTGLLSTLGLLSVTSFPMGVVIIHGFGVKRMESGGVNLQLYIGFKPHWSGPWNDWPFKSYKI